MDRQSRSRLNHFFKNYKGTIILGGGLLILANVFLVWIPVFVRQTINDVESTLNSHQLENVDSVLRVMFNSEVGVLLGKNALLLTLAVCCYGVLLFLTRQTIIVASRKIEFDIRATIFKKLLDLPKSFYASHKIGDIYVRASEDVNKVRMYYGPAVMYAINTLSRMGIILAMMFYVSTPLTLWAIIPLPFLSFMAYWISGYINSKSRIIQEQYSVIAGRAQEAFSSIRLIKAYAREDYELNRFKEESENYRVKKLKLDLVESLFIPSLSLFVGSAIVLVLWKGGELIMQDVVSVGNIAEFIIYVNFLTWPVASLGYTLNLYQQAMASWERIDYILEHPVEINDQGVKDVDATDQKKVNETKFEGNIRFEDVTFKFPDSDFNALQKINLAIKAGQHVAIVGRTGAGKSSLVQLIPRLFDPTEGRIFIDGRDIREIPLEELRDHIGYVTQETFLFSDSIAENIAFGVQNAEFNQIDQAADKAQVRENILEFEKKYDTILGEKGITLSGGQKQRTAIARALIKEPEIIIFDDSLSAVDTKTEKAILQHLRNELQGKTTIMISHRVSTIQHADVIFVLEDGQITEAGSHQDLIQNAGHYANMYKKQVLEEELETL